MQYKNFNVFIQNNFKKYFLINKFYLFSNEWNFSNSARLLAKFILGKLNISITQNQKGHF